MIEPDQGYLAFLIPNDLAEKEDISTGITVFSTDLNVFFNMRNYDIEVEKDNYFIDIICK